MPQIDAQILSAEPLQISDTGINFFEVNSLNDEIYDQLNSDSSKTFKLVLLDWSFTFKKVPNSHEHYLDIKAVNYRVQECDSFVN